MAISEDWLTGPITRAEAEEEVAGEMPPDLWLSRWWAFLGGLSPGDELWEYHGVLCQASGPGPGGDLLEEYHVGFAWVRDGHVVDSIEVPWLA